MKTIANLWQLFRAAIATLRKPVATAIASLLQDYCKPSQTYGKAMANLCKPIANLCELRAFGTWQGKVG
jgi:hypothetical protein